MILTVSIRIGVFGVSPSSSTVAIRSTTSRPDVTRANTVYCPSRARHSPIQMKKDVDPLAGSSPRAIETMPGTFGVSLNSGSRFFTSACWVIVSGLSRKASAPVWMTNPGATRCTSTPS
jgi:hypothetical protein